MLKNEIVFMIKIYSTTSHQFGFRFGHSTMKQVNRIFNGIKEDLEYKRFYSTALLVVAQALLKFGTLVYCLKSSLSYLTRTTESSNLTCPKGFFKLSIKILSLIYLKLNRECSKTVILSLFSIPHIMYIFYSFDLLSTLAITIATFADNTTLFSSNLDPATASSLLQTALDNTSAWPKKLENKS